MALCFLFAPPSARAEEEPPAFARAVAFYEQRKLDQALQWAREAALQHPEHADAHFLLGELYYLRQELTRAEECWEKALKLAPKREEIQERLDRVRKDLQVEKGLARGDTHPFIVRFAEGQVPVETGSLREILRDTHRKVGQQMGYFPAHSITVILYPEQQFQQVKGVSHQVAGLYDGKIRLPLRDGKMAGTELQRVLWHEYTHAVVQDLSLGKCPLWLNEGIATLLEARVVRPSLNEAKSAFKAGTLPAWSALWSQDYKGVSLPLCYETSYLIAQYLVKRWSWREMAGLLGRLGQGQPIGEALRAQYRADPAVIEKEWKAWLRRQL